MNSVDLALSDDALNAALVRFLNRITVPFRLLVAVSGGSDSKGLLIALHQLLHHHPHITLAAATIDHGLRTESAAEAQDVATLCAQLGIAHAIRHWNGPKPTTGISAAAREARYSLLADAARALGANAIVTGHTADDQLETIAMRKQRSATEDAPGLSGMADRVLYRNQIWIYRPLLSCRRQMIRDFLSHQGLSWMDDPSNTNSHYERARVRATLAKANDINLPRPERREEISQQAARLIEAHVHKPVAGVIAIDQAAWQAPSSVLRHALQALVATVGGQSHGPAAQALTQVMTLFQRPGGARITLGRCLAHRHRHGLLLVREARGLQAIILAPNETAVWDGRWQIRNSFETELRVTESTLTQMPDDKALPASIVALGQQSQPQFHLSGETLPTLMRADTDYQSIISQYFSFLPGFDWPLACTLVELFEAKPFFPADF
ncbi:tRNA lysidine(34) synthetase TilS [Rhizobium oryziradicis]|uniref:tRNA(Ile)-lysidine synthase n=1 Tax=Rhizobium oryziradicis TaxID=1867956 RepID=A0A1Q8ZPX1_9HYPH|nr:tRNA lysidine(34) synthetase TilS [Rhizobium oryziradicis]OLP44107.1 tRNA lysidine(34) synthetase TilS [Rhizobium oryziradicis]